MSAEQEPQPLEPPEPPDVVEPDPAPPPDSAPPSSPPQGSLLALFGDTPLHPVPTRSAGTTDKQCRTATLNTISYLEPIVFVVSFGAIVRSQVLWRRA
jgi:hypothetical protein